MSLGNAAQWLTPTAIQVSHHKWLGALLYPRSRVLCQHSAIPYVAVVVISCNSYWLLGSHASRLLWPNAYTSLGPPVICVIE